MYEKEMHQADEIRDRFEEQQRELQKLLDEVGALERRLGELETHVEALKTDKRKRTKG